MAESPGTATSTGQAEASSPLPPADSPELEGLADKTAATLATSLEKVTRATAALVGDAIPSGTVGAGQGAARYVFTHILVGDGIATNARAARILRAAAQENPPHGNLWYLLLVVVCASHSTNLTVASVARGRIAQSALANAAVGAGGGQSAADARDRAQSESAVHRQACGMIVRYNKYLVNDYYSEFRANLRGWAGALQIQAPAGRRAEAAERASALQRLYTERVLPNAALAVLNNGVTYREHCVPAPAAAECARDPAAYKRLLVEQLVGCLRPRLLNVSEHPTETRFFTFRQHEEAALLLVLLGVSSELRGECGALEEGAPVVSPRRHRAVLAPHRVVHAPHGSVARHVRQHRQGGGEAADGGLFRGR